jgi:hypothetical protein
LGPVAVSVPEWIKMVAEVLGKSVPGRTYRIFQLAEETLGW